MKFNEKYRFLVAIFLYLSFVKGFKYFSFVNNLKILYGSRPEFLPDGYTIDLNIKCKSTKSPIPVNSVEKLKDLINQGYKVKDLDVRGDTRVEDRKSINIKLA